MYFDCKKKTILSNKIIFLIFFVFFILFSFFIINQYTHVLNYTDILRFFLGDGAAHIHNIDFIDKKISFHKIHYSELYNNNYYVFSLIILKFLKIFPGYDYSTVGISPVIINLLSIFTICIAGYLLSFQLSKSKIFSIGLICLLWNYDLISFSLRIYPDILQLAFSFLSIYSITLTNKYKWFLSFVFSGLAFGVKLSGLFIFVYLITLFFIFEFSKQNFRVNSYTILIFKKVILYILLFLTIFFLLNHISPLMLFKNLFSAAYNSNVQEYDNYKIVYKYFLYILRDKNNFIFFIIIILYGLVSIFFEKKNKIFFVVSLVFLILFYFQLSNNSTLVQGPRYLNHLIPLILVLVSISFRNFSNYLNQKKLNKINIIIVSLFFIYSFSVFNKTFFQAIKQFDFKTQIKNDPMMDGYRFLETKAKNNKNSLVCAGYYSAIPRNSDGFQNVKVSYYHLDFEKIILNKTCDIIVLDSSTPGRYIWFKKDLDNLNIKYYEKLGEYVKLYGKEKIEQTQNLIKFILKNPKSGYKVEFYNEKIIILTNK